MSKRTTESMGKSSLEWDELEDWLRGSMQNLIQQVLEEEVTEFFGQGESQRAGQRGTAIAVYRNRTRQTEEVDVEWWDGRVEEAASAQHRREVREQAIAAVRQKDRQGI